MFCVETMGRGSHNIHSSTQTHTLFLSLPVSLLVSLCVCLSDLFSLAALCLWCLNHSTQILFSLVSIIAVCLTEAGLKNSSYTSTALATMSLASLQVSVSFAYSHFWWREGSSLQDW